MGRHYKKNKIAIFRYKIQDTIDKIINIIFVKACAAIDWIDDKIDEIGYIINEYVFERSPK